MTKFPAFVRIFVARQVISLTMPSLPATFTQCPTRNGFSIWIARPAKRLPRVSWSANPITTAPTAVVAKIRSCRITRHRDGEQADDDGVLDDRRKAVGQPIGPPRIDGQRDGGVDDAEREQQRLDGRELSEQIG